MKQEVVFQIQKLVQLIMVTEDNLGMETLGVHVM
jgi:hypothetical protein